MSERIFLYQIFYDQSTKASLERGYRPESRVLDGPINVKGWKPENSSREFKSMSAGERNLRRVMSAS
jgi:hypothetical protein